MSKIDFIIIGVAKCGTTFLDSFLKKHPQVQMPKDEMHYFDISKYSDSEYHQQYNWDVDDIIRGEKTPSYIYIHGALERIKKYRSDIKIVICLRNPLDRIVSHHLMNFHRGDVSANIDDYIDRELSGLNTQRTFKKSQTQYIGRSLYCAQLDRVYELFSREQVFIFNLDEYKKNGTELQKLCSFLGISYKHNDSKLFIRKGKYTESEYQKYRNVLLQNEDLIQRLNHDMIDLKNKYHIDFLIKD